MQGRFFTAKIGRCLIALAILVTTAAIFFSSQSPASTSAMEPQTPSKQRRSRSKPKSGMAIKAAPAFTKFKHESHHSPKTGLNCWNCHTIPAETAPDVIAAATKPSIQGYPYHDSCLSCHRQTPPQFFRGTNPSICTVCHTSSSPRLTARDLSPFPKNNEEARDLQFPGSFPHAQRDHKREKCVACHLTDQRAYVEIKISDSEAPYKPVVGSFKTSPSSHAACFKCHWEDAKPRKDQCAGCHLRNEDFVEEARNELSADAMKWFKNWPLRWPKRLSLKFNHDSHDLESHQKPDCTDCHTNLTEMNTLDILKADVKIAACATCHFRKLPNIGEEMTEEDALDIKQGKNISPASKDGQHTCKGCHTNEIGSAPTPCSHYLLPDKYLDLDEYSDNARQIAKQCKENKK